MQSSNRGASRQKQDARVDLHGWDTNGEVESHEEVNPALPAAPKPGVDQAVPLCGLPKAGCPKNPHRAIHQARHPCSNGQAVVSRHELLSCIPEHINRQIVMKPWDKL